MSKRITIQAFGALLDRPPIWSAWVLGRLNVAVSDLDDSFDGAEFATALERTLRLRGDVRAAHMGTTLEEARGWLIHEFERYGLRLHTRTGRNGACLVFLRPDHTTVCVWSYVALTVGKHGRAGFTISRLYDEDVEWFAFVAPLFGKVQLRQREEVLSRRSASQREAKAITGVTIGPDTDVSSFHDRIQELVKGAKK